jgi:hypothetical protein
VLAERAAAPGAREPAARAEVAGTTAEAEAAAAGKPVPSTRLEAVVEAAARRSSREVLFACAITGEVAHGMPTARL